MAKTPKKPWLKGKQDNAPSAKDDGTRWIVVRRGRPVYYSSGGVLKDEAQRLAEGLLEPAETLQVS